MPKESTRKQNEDIPIVKPENCPGELIKYMNRKRAADNEAMAEVIRQEMEPVHQFARMAANNRSWIQIITVAVALMFAAGCAFIIG